MASSILPDRNARIAANVMWGENSIPIVIKRKQIAHKNITRIMRRCTFMVAPAPLIHVSTIFPDPQPEATFGDQF
jgi:hypothetical protein